MVRYMIYTYAKAYSPYRRKQEQQAGKNNAPKRRIRNQEGICYLYAQHHEDIGSGSLVTLAGRLAHTGCAESQRCICREYAVLTSAALSGWVGAL